jgi:leucyl aminopeptidase (aminopeptidase T)
MKDEIIKKVISGMQLRKGQLVLLHFWGEDKYIPTLRKFSEYISDIGAVPFEYQEPVFNNISLFTKIEEPIPEKYFKIFETFDIVIDIFMQYPINPYKGSGCNAEQYYRAFMIQTFSEMTKKEKFIQLRVPTVENAELSGIDTDKYIELMIKAYDVDCDIIREESNDFINTVSNKENVNITTNKGEVSYFLKLELGDRKWIIDAGDGDLPCGEVYIAPLENGSNGDIYFKNIKLINGKYIEEVVIHIENGRVISSNSNIFNQHLKELPDDGLILCEFGIGMNPNVTEFSGITVLDEKKKGSFHIGFGSNTMFGGENKSDIHMDFVGVGDFTFY